MDHWREQSVAHRLEGTGGGGGGALCSQAQGKLATLLWVAKAPDVVVLKHSFILRKASWLGEGVAAEPGPPERVSGGVRPVLHSALVGIQNMVQVDGLVATDESRGLPVPVHGQDGDGVAMGIHASPSGIRSDLPGIVGGEDHALLLLLLG